MTTANDDIVKSAGTSSIDISVEESQTDADSRRKDGEFVRDVSGFRHHTGDADFPVETEHSDSRVHLFYCAYYLSSGASASKAIELLIIPGACLANHCVEYSDTALRLTIKPTLEYPPCPMNRARC